MTRLLKLQDEIAMALVKAQVGQTVKVLVEGFGRSEGKPLRPTGQQPDRGVCRRRFPDGQLCQRTSHGRTGDCAAG